MARLVLLITVSLAFALADMEDAFRKNTIIPDVVEYAPQQSLKVTYPNNTEANEGNEVTPTQSKTEPKVTWEAEATDFYTLIMTDPDAPSRVDPKAREWHHWLVVNIPANDVSKGEVLTEYVGAGPPQGTGYHRYVFLVYRQNGKTEFDEKKLTNKSADNRANFNTTAFVEKHNLGKPIAGNFFQAVYDDYVPTLYKQLGVKSD